MNWTLCCSFLVILCFIVGIAIGMPMKSENEKQKAFKRFAKWLGKQKGER